MCCERVCLSYVYVCDEIFFFFPCSSYIFVVDWESFIVWIVRITHLVFHFILFVFFSFLWFLLLPQPPIHHRYINHYQPNQTLHPPTTSRAVPDFIEFLRKTKQTPKPKTQTNQILSTSKTDCVEWIDRRAVGLTTMGAMSVTVSLNTNGVGLDSTLSTIAAPATGPGSAPITNGSSPTNNQTTIGAVTSSPATVGTAPAAAAAAAAITSANNAANNNAGGVLSPVRVDL